MYNQTHKHKRYHTKYIYNTQRTQTKLTVNKHEHTQCKYTLITEESTHTYEVSILSVLT